MGPFVPPEIYPIIVNEKWKYTLSVYVWTTRQNRKVSIRIRGNVISIDRGDCTDIFTETTMEKKDEKQIMQDQIPITSMPTVCVRIYHYACLSFSWSTNIFVIMMDIYVYALYLQIVFTKTQLII